MPFRSSKTSSSASRFPSGLLPAIIIVVAVLLIVFLTNTMGFAAGLGFAMIPLILLGLISIIVNPYWSYISLFVVSYFVIALNRYSGVEGWSVFFDSLIVITLVSVVLNRVFMASVIQKTKIGNGLLIATAIWIVYCVLELLNPTAMLSAWTLSRSLIFYQFVITLLTLWIVDDFRKLNFLLMLLSVLTLLGFGKALIQVGFGFDSVERVLLAGDLGKTHLLQTGVRYFSFYASAGIFGVVMGHALVVFLIASIYTQSLGKRIYFIIVAGLALYGMLLSGTRGALAVPAGGFALFVLLSKKWQIMIPSLIVMVAAYVLLAMTTIGQSNAMIRRMRTVFDPNESSLLVRLENQKRLSKYLESRPFGEGLGLSGVEAQASSMRFTTSIPTDSWYVKIWVETGVVGLCLHIGILLYILIYGSYLILFKLRDVRVRGVMTALLSGICGVLLASYGNLVLGQYPVASIIYISMALVFMAPYFDKKAQEDGVSVKF